MYAFRIHNIRFVTALELIKSFIHVKTQRLLLACAPELPANIGRLAGRKEGKEGIVEIQFKKEMR